MRLGIMQPYFAPYIGHFALINQCDHWIVFDTAQYIRHGWVNRNRILHPTEGWQYILVPIQRHSRKTPIKDIKIVPCDDWRNRIQGQLQHYRRKAPHFREVMALLNDACATPTESLSELNVTLLRKVCAYLGIRFNCELFSSMPLSLPPITDPGQWALEISSALGATEYINPAGGEELFDRAAFEARGIKLTLFSPPHYVYDCPSYQYQPDLSILDVLMWNSPEQVLFHLKKCAKQ
jgi:hypothetical protein